MTLLLSTSRVARVIGMSHRCLAVLVIFELWSHFYVQTGLDLFMFPLVVGISGLSYCLAPI
jgi:hypothetical protein